MARENRSNENVFFVDMKNMKKSDDECYIRCYESATKKEDKIKAITGTLFKIRFEEATYEGKTFNIVKLYFKDDDEVYILKSRFTVAMRGILNKLLNCPSYINIRIGVFGNAGDFKNAYIQCNGEKVDYMFPKEHLEQYIDSQVNPKGETVKYYHRLEEFLTDQIKKVVIPRLDVDAITEKDEEEVKSNSVKEEPKQSNVDMPTDKPGDVPF